MPSLQTPLEKEGGPTDGDAAVENESARRGRARMKPREVASFMNEFATMISAGLPVDRALTVVAKSAASASAQQTAEQIRTRVRGGATVADALAADSATFDPIITGIIDAAERSSQLGEGLRYVAELLESEAEVRSKMATALAYPAVLLSIGFAAIISILYFVVPRFSSVIIDVGGEDALEGFAATISRVSAFAISPLGILLTLAATAGPVAWFIWARNNSRQKFDGVLNAIPFVGGMLMLGELSRVASMLRLMTANGVPMRDALERTRNAATHSYVRRVLNAVITNVENGRPMSEAFAKFDALPGEVSEMIAVGEESGRLQHMLEHLAATLRRRLATQVERAPVILQPVMLVAVGGIVVAIFATYFLPYINLLTALSHAQ